MKNIKIRVFNKETNKMQYQFGEMMCYDDEVYFPFEHFDLITDINDLIIMQQFEPSLDIVVFEGDLVMADCQILGHKKKRQLCKIGRNGRGMNISIYNKGEFYAYKSMDFSSIEVVGNIHENKELINIS